MLSLRSIIYYLISLIAAIAAVLSMLQLWKSQDTNALNTISVILLGLTCLIPAIHLIYHHFALTMYRYIHAKLWQIFGFTLICLVSLWIIIDFQEHLSDFSKTSNPAFYALSFYVLQLPSILKLLIPCTLLISCLIILTQFSKNQEVLIFLQTGKSPFSTLKPCFFVTFSSLVLCLFLNYYLEPKAQQKFLKFEQNLSLEGVDFYAVNRLIPQTGRFWVINQFPTAHPSSQDKQAVWEFSDLAISQTNQEHELTHRYLIEKARWDAQTQQWEFSNIVQYAFNTDEEQPHLIKTTKTPSWSPKWTETPYKLLQANMTPIEMTVPLLSQRLQSAKAQEQPQIQTLLNQRIFDPITCLASCLLAMSLGLNFERKQSGKNTLLAIALMVAMLLCSHLGYSLGAAAILPAWLATLMTPVVFCGIGLWILRKQLGWFNS